MELILQKEKKDQLCNSVLLLTVYGQKVGWKSDSF